jgi:hypothetical protein
MDPKECFEELPKREMLYRPISCNKLKLMSESELVEHLKELYKSNITQSIINIYKMIVSYVAHKYSKKDYDTKQILIRNIYDKIVIYDELVTNYNKEKNHKKRARIKGFAETKLEYNKEDFKTLRNLVNIETYEEIVKVHNNSNHPRTRARLKENAKYKFSDMFNNKDFNSLTIKYKHIEYLELVQRYNESTDRKVRTGLKQSARTKLEFNNNDFNKLVIPRKKLFKSYKDAVNAYNSSNIKTRSNIKKYARNTFIEFREEDFDTKIIRRQDKTYKELVSIFNTEKNHQRRAGIKRYCKMNFKQYKESDFIRLPNRTPYKYTSYNNFVSTYVVTGTENNSSKRSSIKIQAKNRYPNEFKESDFPRATRIKNENI